MINLKDIQEYISNNYNINFELVYEEPTNYEKYEKLVYKSNKKEYEIEVGFAQHNYQEKWSIYHNYMDYKEWYGFGGAEVDQGFKTIDEIMKNWKFKKQMTIFDFIGEENE